MHWQDDQRSGPSISDPDLTRVETSENSTSRATNTDSIRHLRLPQPTTENETSDDGVLLVTDRERRYKTKNAIYISF